MRERYVAIRERDTQRLVTVIEILSPANKRVGSNDRKTYLDKRNELVRGGVNLVEIDLLRGGERLPVETELPQADFFAIVCRASEWPRAAAYAWTLRQHLPVVPIPLADPDPDVPLNLQALFTTVYDRAGYDYSLDYRGDSAPALPEEDRAWARELLPNSL